jgi:hypothetical protein
MGLRDELQKRIDRKAEENAEYERKIRENNAYMQALQETIKLLPKEPPAMAKSGDAALRKGSTVYNVREAIRKAGKPLHIKEILKALDKPIDRETRSSVSGTLGPYVREGKIFTRPEPNTFGLIEMATSSSSGENDETPTDAENEDESRKPLLQLNGAAA